LYYEHNKFTKGGYSKDSVQSVIDDINRM